MACSTRSGPTCGMRRSSKRARSTKPSAIASRSHGAERSGDAHEAAGVGAVAEQEELRRVHGRGAVGRHPSAGADVTTPPSRGTRTTIFSFRFPKRFPTSGGPGELINEVHSFGMMFSGCFYDLIAKIFAAQPTQTPDEPAHRRQDRRQVLVGGATAAIISPRFLQAVGRAMVLADESRTAGQHRDQIRAAFEAPQHPARRQRPAGAGRGARRAPRAGRGRGRRSPATRKDLADRLGAAEARLCGRRPSCRGSDSRARSHPARPARIGRQAAQGRHRRCAGVDDGRQLGGRAALMGQMPELVSTEREVEAFVKALIANGQVELGGGTKAAAATGRRRGAVGGADAASRCGERRTASSRSPGARRSNVCASVASAGGETRTWRRRRPHVLERRSARPKPGRRRAARRRSGARQRSTRRIDRPCRSIRNTARTLRRFSNP